MYSGGSGEGGERRGRRRENGLRKKYSGER